MGEHLGIKKFTSISVTIFNLGKNRKSFTHFHEKSERGKEGLFMPTDTNTTNIPSIFEQQTVDNFHLPEPAVLSSNYDFQMLKDFKINGSIREPEER